MWFSLFFLGTWIGLRWTAQLVLLSLFWFLWGLIFVFFTNYAFPNKVWTYRFREINGEDHSGPLLESSMLFLLTLLAVVAGAFFYPDSSRALFFDYVLSWPGLVGAIVLLAAATYTCLVITPASLDEEFKERGPDGRRLISNHNAKFEALSPSEWAHELNIVKTRTERAYLFLCFQLGASLLLGVVFLAGGVKDDIEMWSTDQARLRQAVENLDRWADRDGSVFAPEVIRDAERITPTYTVLVDHSIPAYERYLGLIAIFFAIGYWFVGTGYQKVYTESVANMMRGFALIILFVVLPAVLVTGYASLVNAANDVTHAMTRVSVRAITEADRSAGREDASTVNRDADRTEIETAWFRDFSDARARFDEQVLSTGFFTRMATSWGGAWMLLWFVASIFLKARKNLLLLLVPPFSKRTKNLFASMFLFALAADSAEDEDDAG